MDAPGVTELLLRWGEGDVEARDQLVPLVYAELRRIASRHMAREREGHMLQTTALVHEAYLRLIDQDRVRWQNRAHFLGISAHIIRRVLLDHARAGGAQKRGGAVLTIGLDEVADQIIDEQRGADVIQMDEALTRLSELDPAQGRIVELRFFGGLTIEETAEAVGSSPATVKREWALARAWLHRELSGSAP